MSEDGWPYPDDDDAVELAEPPDPRFEPDDDLVALHALRRDAILGLSATERAIIVQRFGFDGHPPRTLNEIHEATGLPRREIRATLLAAVDKLRSQLL
ncbi:MAG TPA: sigma factor-like helix-turn-helix DNA-binding protein [Acidimicrobiales bacterium]